MYTVDHTFSYENTNTSKKEECFTMHILQLKKITSIVLSTLIVLASLLVTGDGTAVAGATAAASPRGELAYVVHLDHAESGIVTVIDTRTKRVIATIPVGEGPDAVVVTPDGKQAYVVHNIPEGTVWAIDTKSKKRTALIPVGENPSAIAITPDGRRAYVTGNHGVSVIDTAKNAVVDTISSIEWTPNAIAVTPDGKHVYVSNRIEEGEAVSVIDTANHAVIAVIPFAGEAPQGIVVSPDGKYVYVAKASGVAIIDTQTQAFVETVKDGFNKGVVVTPDGKYVYTTNFYYVDATTKGVAVINTETRKIEKTIPFEFYAFRIAMASDGRHVYVTNYERNTVSVIDTKTNATIATIPVREHPGDIAIAPIPQ
jgi:YVTN family beta-propeller protein